MLVGRIVVTADSFLCSSLVFLPASLFGHLGDSQSFTQGTEVQYVNIKVPAWPRTIFYLDDVFPKRLLSHLGMLVCETVVGGWCLHCAFILKMFNCPEHLYAI